MLLKNMAKKFKTQLVEEDEIEEFKEENLIQDYNLRFLVIIDHGYLKNSSDLFAFKSWLR